MRCTPIAYLSLFLLTPLREGRQDGRAETVVAALISTHAPAGGATQATIYRELERGKFLLTPLREGRQQFSTSPS